ncbi:hypothetical protein MXB_4456 [Myxobolus squamalis]|nr:hypothetical protein MXB_4456 [Myxobolus squamalis]
MSQRIASLIMVTVNIYNQAQAPAVVQIEKSNDLSIPVHPIPDRGAKIRERPRFKRCMEIFFENLKIYGVCNPNLANLKKSTPKPKENLINKIHLVPNYLPFDSTIDQNSPCWYSDLPPNASNAAPVNFEENLLLTCEPEDCDKYSLSKLENILSNEVSMGFMDIDSPADVAPSVETRIEKCTEKGMTLFLRVDYHVPVEYLVYQFVKEKLAKIDCKLYNDELLFYIYYTIEEDQIKLAAITNL